MTAADEYSIIGVRAELARVRAELVLAQAQLAAIDQAVEGAQFSEPSPRLQRIVKLRTERSDLLETLYDMVNQWGGAETYISANEDAAQLLTDLKMIPGPWRDRESGKWE